MVIAGGCDCSGRCRAALVVIVANVASTSSGGSFWRHLRNYVVFMPRAGRARCDAGAEAMAALRRATAAGDGGGAAPGAARRVLEVDLGMSRSGCAGRRWRRSYSG
jgi:hypothetical protein